MQIGIIGSPNKGKTTIFSALTMVEAEIAPYPFTTIKPNIGVAYAMKPCVDRELGVTCNPRNSLCVHGIRHIPVNIIDVAGLVPDAHLGRGMGNQFLNDLIGADVLVQIVDLSGKTDAHGNPCEWYDPAEEVSIVHEEVISWLYGIIAKHIKSISRRMDGDRALTELLSGFGIGEEQVRKAAEANFLGTSQISWGANDMRKFTATLLDISKPMIIAANKMDISSAKALDDLERKVKGATVIGCSGAIELALRKAGRSGVIEYAPGAAMFRINKSVSQEQKDALDYMADYVRKNKGTGVQDIINTAVFKILDRIVVYPVEDENKYTDHFGNVLPDAILMKRKSKAIDLAEKIHTDLAKSMLYAVDARKKLKVGKGYELKDNDVIRIVSAAR